MGRLTRRTKDHLGRTGIAVGVYDVYKYSPHYEAWSKLAHYEDLEEAGRLIELPCAVGDKIYFIVNTDEGNEIMWGLVEGIHIHRYAEYSLQLKAKDSIDLTAIPSIPLNSFGEILFKTKEEAEAKLKELEGENEKY